MAATPNCYCAGQAAPVFTQASTSAPACFCVPGAGLRPKPGRPGPADQRILADMVDQILELAAAVARGILDLRADLGNGLALPRHFARREMPFRMTGHAAGIEIGIL